MLQQLVGLQDTKSSSAKLCNPTGTWHSMVTYAPLLRSARIHLRNYNLLSVKVQAQLEAFNFLHSFNLLHFPICNATQG